MGLFGKKTREIDNTRVYNNEPHNDRENAWYYDVPMSDPSRAPKSSSSTSCGVVIGGKTYYLKNQKSVKEKQKKSAKVPVPRETPKEYGKFPPGSISYFNSEPSMVYDGRSTKHDITKCNCKQCSEYHTKMKQKIIQN